MSDLLNNIGSFFSSGAGKGIETLAGLGATGAGLAGNISADQQRSAAAKSAQANMNLTPAQLAQQVGQATQPLNSQLVQSVTGNVNANQQEMGLSQAPGLTAQAVASGLAPYEQQNQQNAMQLVMQKLGLPAEFARTIPPNANMSQLLALLMKGNNVPGTPATPNPMGFQTTGPTPPPQTTDANTPGGGTQGSYDFASLVDPSAGLS